MSKIIAAILNAAGAIALAVSFLIIAWLFTFPGRIWSCEQTVTRYFQDSDSTAIRRFCFDEVKP